MARKSDKALAEAVNALYRIRAVESPPGEDGLRTVWHQCAQGADLASWVDQKGHVVRQELTLLDDYFRWTREHGLTTGAVSEASVSYGAAPEGLELDREISSERVLRAAAALGGYQGEDRYVLHLRRVLNLVRQGMQSDEDVTVTRSAPSRPPDLRAPPPERRYRLLLVAAALSVLLVAAAVAISMILA